MDGGIRSGLDVLKALALGAKACFVGRAWAYALGRQANQGYATCWTPSKTNCVAGVGPPNGQHRLLLGRHLFSVRPAILHRRLERDLRIRRHGCNNEIRLTVRCSSQPNIKQSALSAPNCPPPLTHAGNPARGILIKSLERRFNGFDLIAMLGNHKHRNQPDQDVAPENRSGLAVAGESRARFYLRILRTGPRCGQ